MLRLINEFLSCFYMAREAEEKAGVCLQHFLEVYNEKGLWELKRELVRYVPAERVDHFLGSIPELSEVEEKRRKSEREGMMRPRRGSAI